MGLEFRPSRSLAAVMLVSATLTGCYHYTPIGEVIAEAGHDVRLHVTDRASVDLATHIGPQVEMVEGQLLAVTDSGYTVRMSATISRRNIETAWAGERVTFSRDAITRIDRKSFDRGRSFVVGGGAVAGVVLAGVAFNALGGNNGSRGGRPGEPPR
jgi:hypothetical protein